MLSGISEVSVLLLEGVSEVFVVSVGQCLWKESLISCERSLWGESLCDVSVSLCWTVSPRSLCVFLLGGVSACHLHEGDLCGEVSL